MQKLFLNALKGFAATALLFGTSYAQSADPIADLLSAKPTAQPAIEGATPQALGPNEARPALWHVYDDDSHYVLLGSFHVLPPSLNWRTDEIETAAKNAERFYFEVEADSADANATTLNVLMSEGFNKNGGLLSSMLSANHTSALKNIVAEVRLPFASVDRMRPWQAFLTLSVQLIVDQGFKPGAGVDSKLLAEGRVHKKELRFFESMKQQLGFFTNLKSDTELKLLQVTIDEWDQQQEEFTALYDAWRAGDTDFIDNAMNETMAKELPSVFKTLIVNRNKEWTAAIADDMRADDKSALVVVGAAHLVGDKSVPALLRKRGFKVVRHDYDAPGEAAANDNAPE